MCLTSPFLSNKLVYTTVLLFSYSLSFDDEAQSIATRRELSANSGMTTYKYCQLAPNRFRILEILQIEPSVQPRLVEEDDSTEREYNTHPMLGVPIAIR